MIYRLQFFMNILKKMIFICLSVNKILKFILNLGGVRSLLEAELPWLRPQGLGLWLKAVIAQEV